MELHEVKLTKKENFILLVKTTYDFLPLKKIALAGLIYGPILYYGDSIFISEKGVVMPFIGQLTLTTILSAVMFAIIFLLIPIIYEDLEDLWVNTIRKNFRNRLYENERYMQREILRKTDEIILQQERK